MSQEEEPKADLAIDFGRPRVASGPVARADELAINPDVTADGGTDDGEFDRADFDEGGQACASCQSVLCGSFYNVNGASVCEMCGRAITEHQKEGTTPSALIRAIAFGAVPAGIGGLIWWALLEFAHFQLALIAIAIGYGVGAAVRMASGGRGGVPYQVVAVALTYFAVAGAYVPFFVGSPTYEQMFAESTPELQAQIRGVVAEGKVPALENGLTIEEGFEIMLNTEVSEATLEGLSPQADAAERERVVAALGPYFEMPFGEAIILALKAPFDREGGSMFLGLLIIGFGLWQAFKMNARTVLDVSGPHQLADPAAQT